MHYTHARERDSAGRKERVVLYITFFCIRSAAQVHLAKKKNTGKNKKKDIQECHPVNTEKGQEAGFAASQDIACPAGLPDAGTNTRYVVPNIDAADALPTPLPRLVQEPKDVCLGVPITTTSSANTLENDNDGERKESREKCQIRQDATAKRRTKRKDRQTARKRKQRE